MLKTLLRCLATLTAATLTTFAAAQEASYPSRPVTVIVPFPPGGYADIVMRDLQPALERSLGQSIVVINKAGAGGALGAASAAQAKADGYTLLYTLASIISLPEQAIVNNQTPLLKLDDLVPIARVTTDYPAIVVPANSPYQTLPELIADAKARPGMVSFASSGNYGSSHVPVAMFSDATGTRFNHVPYPGGSQMIVAMLANQVDFGAFSRSFVNSQVQAGKMRFLASYGKTRWTDPAIPSFADYGIDVDYDPWTGVFAPARTPPAVLERVRAAFRAAAADPQFKAAMSRLGGEIAYADGDEMAAFWKADVARVTKAVRKIGRIE